MAPPARGSALPKIRGAAGHRSALGRAYERLAMFDVASLFAKRREIGPPRTVYVNQPLPEDYFDKKRRVKKEHVYTTNQVITSKYTILTFLPRNLLEQFRRIANIFFAGIAILQFFEEFSTVSPGLVILPLIIVLGITAIKDGYEDVKRHQSDKRVNQSQVRTLVGADFENANASTGKKKTFVRGLVPRGRGGKGSTRRTKGAADVEMQAGSAPPEAIASEANASSAPPQRPEVGHDHGDIEFDDDDHTEDTTGADGGHHGLFHHKDKETRAHWRKTAWEDVRVGDVVKVVNDEQIPADILICATSEDENVAYVETKNLDGETNLKSRNAAPALTYMRNAAAAADRSQAFSVECDRPDPNMYKFTAAIVDKAGKTPVDLQNTLLRGTVLRNTGWVIGVVLYTGEDTKIVLNSGGTPSKRSKVERQMNPQVFINLILLAAMAITCGIVDSVLERYYFDRNAPWMYGATLSDDNPEINGLITWAFALITFQNIVPISLYISIEAVRTVQAAFIYFDKEIWYEKTDQPTLARSWNLSDDLGQIEYIFSDKTGTLTQNSMVFRQCSVGGRAYRGDPEMAPGHEADEKMTAPITEVKKPMSASEHTDSEATSSQASPQVNSGVPDPLAAPKIKLSNGVLQHFKDTALSGDMARAVHAADPETGAPVDEAQWARSLNGFFTVLSLCHTVLTAVDPETGALEYKAQSPDEAALVQAAADVGFIFRGREREVLRLQTPFADEIQEFELLNILEFTSARKRMSVIVRKLAPDDQRLFLLAKGADNVIFERLKKGEDELKSITEAHLDEFANDGLRTLTLAYKVIPEEFYEEWSHRYHEATVSLDEREEKIEACADEIERELRLLGATAIEDRLQDGVPETIADLKRAGIKIWVATGDKLETAIAIGHSTNLIQKDSNIIVVRGNAENGRPVYEQLLKAVEEFLPESGILEDAGVDETQLDPAENPRIHQIRRVNTGMTEVVGRDNGERPGGFVLVIDGAALTHGLADDQHKHLLLLLATQCEGVICCRVSPMQKALVTRMVREGLGVMTLAIGDGANDVSMIQAADVGVGISGEEGLQAVNSSDYAIAQFRFLKRLLLVHGHWSYARNGTMIVNFFYKNIICIGVLWWWQIYCGWSSNYVFEYTYLLFWNTFWTIAPAIALGIFDRIADDDVLFGIPELYRYGREGRWYTMKKFARYMFQGVYQSAIIYFFIHYAYVWTTTTRDDGYQQYSYEFSTTMILAAVFVANLFNGLSIKAWTWWVVFAVTIGPILVWIWTAVYAAISPGWIVTPIYGNNHYLFASPMFWLGMFFVTLLAIAPSYIARAIQTGYFPDDLDILRYNRKMHPERDLVRDALAPAGLARLQHNESRSTVATEPGRARPCNDPRMASRTDMSTGLRSVHRGFDFAQEEGGVAIRRMQTNLSEVRQSNLHLPRRRRNTLVGALRRTIRRKRPPTAEGLEEVPQ